MNTTQRPVWTERDQPTTQLLDVTTADEDSAALPPHDVINKDYLGWVNSYKRPLHIELRERATSTADRLMEHGVDPLTIAQVVANLVEAEVYPRHRLITVDDAEWLPAYQSALKANFFNQNVQHTNSEPTTSDFVPTLHFTRLATNHVDTAERVELADTVAWVIGIATLSPVANVAIVRGEETSPVYSWFGTTWRQQGKYFGELLLETAATKLAAETRHRLGYIPSLNESHPVIAPYYRTYTPPTDVYGAIALDLLNKTASMSDPLAIYKPLWAFARSGAQDEAARDEVADIITHATEGRMAIEDLEAAPYGVQGFSLSMLRRVEDACDIAMNARPSSYISTEPR